MNQGLSSSGLDMMVLTVKKGGNAMKKVMAMVHSLEDMAEVTIISETDCNNVIAEYNGKKCTAIFNWFTCKYYVDDIYGVIA
jgi:hypothetical protein